MIAEKHHSIIEQVRALKEENAAEHSFSVSAIIEAARERQESSGYRIIRQELTVEGSAARVKEPVCKPDEDR